MGVIKGNPMLRAFVNKPKSTSCLFVISRNYCNKENELLYHQILGNTSNPTSSIMVIHGLFGSTANWRGISKSLVSQKKLYDQAILVDLRNHGKSFHSPDFSVSEMSQDIEKLIDHLSPPEDFTLMGHSLGGKVAMNVALEGYLENPSKLIVVDVAPKKYDTRASFSAIVTSLMKVDISKDRKREEISADLTNMLPNENEMVIAFLMTNLVQTEKEWKWRVNLDALNKSLERVGDLPTTKMRTTNIKTHFIGGDQSNYIPKDELDNIRSYFPNCTIEFIENAGHWVHYQNPEAFIQSICNFRAQDKE